MPVEIQDELEQLMEEVMVFASTVRHLVKVTPATKGLSLPAHSVLRLLREQPGLTVPQVSRQRGTSRQNSQVLVDRLADAGLAEYFVNPDHERSERLQLTPAGIRALSTANQQQAARLAELVPHVTEEELRSCSEVLGRIRVRLGGRKQVRPQLIRRVRKGRTELQTSASVSIDPSPVESTEEAPVEASSPEALPFNLL